MLNIPEIFVSIFCCPVGLSSQKCLHYLQFFGYWANMQKSRIETLGPRKYLGLEDHRRAEPFWARMCRSIWSARHGGSLFRAHLGPIETCSCPGMQPRHYGSNLLYSSAWKFTQSSSTTHGTPLIQRFSLEEGRNGLFHRRERGH